MAWNRIKKMFKVEKREFSLVIVGLDLSGKTTTILFLDNGGQGDMNTIPTIGANFQSFSIGNIKFNTTDLGGQKDLRDLWNGPVKKADVIVFVVDISDESRYEEAKLEFDKVVYNLRTENKNGVKIPIIVQANKMDLINPNDLTDKKRELISFFGLEDFTDAQNPWHVQLTSALNGEGLAEMMTWIFQKVTNKEQKENFYKEFLIFDKSGMPIISKAKTLGENTLASSFLAAINAFVGSIGDKALSELTMGDLKIIFENHQNLIGAIVIGIQDNSGRAKSVLEKIMKKLSGVDLESMDSEEIKKYYSQAILEQLNFS